MLRRSHNLGTIFFFFSMIPLVILFIYFFTTTQVAANLNNETDRLALLAFKDLISGDPHDSLSSWNDSLPLCHWYGVTCGRRHNRVTVLDIRNQGLGGSISPSIGNLTFLNYIHFQENQLRGTIPNEIVNLPRLLHLNLSINYIQGKLPSNISNYSKLKVINFSFNNLSGEIPSIFGSLPQLTFFSVYQNNLNGRIPPSLGNLTFLKLSLGFNYLIGTIPNSIGYLTNLIFFGVGVNNLTGVVPRPLYNISSLKTLGICCNSFSGSLPQDIGLTLPNLERISVGGNQFYGPFPMSLSNASQLTHLNIRSCGLVGPVPGDVGYRMNNNLGYGGGADLRFVDSLTNCTKLEYLAINDNSFRGQLPKSLSNFSTNLIFLLLGQNEFVGTIPVDICNLVNLIELGLDDSHLHGPIPFEIGKLKSLGILFLDANKLSGPLPFSFGNLTQLSELYLHKNRLTGGISIITDNLRGLVMISLSSNAFTGSIPNSIGNLYSATFIYSDFNFLNGSIPLEIGNLKNLQDLDVTNNRLSGEIPSALGNCLRIEVLFLSSNLFQGKIPTSFGSLKGIKFLNLSHNNLSGEIPIGLEALPDLKVIDVSFNDFLDGNYKLCGGLPILQLPACSTRQSPKNRKSHLKILAIVLGIGACSIFILTFLVLGYYKRKHRKDPSIEQNMEDVFLRLSYADLFTATQGFALTNLLGTGQFSSVYKGILPFNGKQIAVKVLNLDLVGASESFISECEALRITRHRNLLKLITTCSSVNFRCENFKALVFDFMQNGSLDLKLHHNQNDGLPENYLDFSQRLNIAIGVASALDYLHNHCQPPIVHCDLKPNNILLDEDMISHVGDFGLARFLTLGTNEEASSIAIKDTIGYVPPEYGFGGQVSREGDVYSYGILLLEMLTGKRPTDEMFSNGLNLYDYCNMAWPEKVEDIVDSRLVLGKRINAEQTVRGEIKVIKCIRALLSIGLACSAALPYERIDMKNVVMRLNAIDEVFRGIRIHGDITDTCIWGSIMLEDHHR